MKQSIYLSGPMTGLPDYNYPLFHRVAKSLRERGWTVLNPAENFDGRTDLPRSEYIRADIQALIDREVYAIAQLPGWEQSDGARLEYVLARELGLTVYHVIPTGNIGEYDLSEPKHPPASMVLIHDKQPRLLVMPAGLHYSPTQGPDPAKPETILEEAARLTSRDRQGDYGHPRDDFARTADIWNGILRAKLRDGQRIEATDVPLLMIGVKLAREAHRHKRDNPVDIAGYANTIMLVHEKEAQ